METLVGILVLATPVAIVITLFAGLDRREQRRRRETERQIALTDAIHARLGAVAAPVVRPGARAGASRWPCRSSGRRWPTPCWRPCTRRSDRGATKWC